MNTRHAAHMLVDGVPLLWADFLIRSSIENTSLMGLNGHNLNGVMCSAWYIDLVLPATWIKAGKLIRLDKRNSIIVLILSFQNMKNKNTDSKIFVPSHLAETLRYKTYAWNKKADILRLATQVAYKKLDHLSFLGYPLE